MSEVERVGEMVLWKGRRIRLRPMLEVEDKQGRAQNRKKVIGRLGRGKGRARTSNGQ